MSEQPSATDPKTTPVPCAECGSTVHTTGHHDGGAPAERKTDGGMSPMGHHDGGIVAETAKDAADKKKPAGVAGGHHDGGAPSRK